MKNIVIATTKSWNIKNANLFRQNHPELSVKIIDDKSALTSDFLSSILPQYVFLPHWSWIIPPEIHENYNCVVFHMTDLPFGRGGSPLQNLLVRGIYSTKISAIKVDGGLDTGAVYFKEDLDISVGNADDILSHASDIIFDKMIPRFLEEELIASIPQEGEVVSFKRRNSEQSEIPDGLNTRQIYDYIRMLDGEGYPSAFRRYDNGKVYYTNAEYKDGIVTAKACFVEDED